MFVLILERKIIIAPLKKFLVAAVGKLPKFSGKGGSRQEVDPRLFCNHGLHRRFIKSYSASLIASYSSYKRSTCSFLPDKQLASFGNVF